MVLVSARLGVAALVAMALSSGPAIVAGEPPPAPAAGMRRMEALRAQRPGDGILVYYQAMAHAGLG